MVIDLRGADRSEKHGGDPREDERRRYNRTAKERTRPVSRETPHHVKPERGKTWTNHSSGNGTGYAKMGNPLE